MPVLALRRRLGWLVGAMIVLLAASRPNEAAGQRAAPAAAPAVVVPGEARVSITRATTAIRVDARLDDAAWTEAATVEIPWETYPGNNTTAPVRTQCHIAYDDLNVYLGCHAFDASPRAIRAVRADRDDMTTHDRVGITIDPFLDRRRGWEFAVNPLGVQYDAVYDAQSDGSDPAWNAIWTSAGRIVDDGYVIEAAIPFKSLRFPAGSAPQSWGLIVWRQRPRNTNVVLRSVPLDPAVRCLLCQASMLDGMRATRSSHNIELGPTLTSIRTDRRPSPSAPLSRGAMRPELGLDARWNLTPDITVNVTANPDFSQVEADAAQLDANTLFALSYPERRPFFLDGADLFASPRQIVFTRSIAEPVAGVKLTAKTGRTAFGLLAARDAVTNLLLSGRESAPQVRLDRPSTSLATRVRLDVLGSSTIGVLGTLRQGEDYSNRVVGVDALLRPHPTTSVSAQVLGSDTRYPDSVAAVSRQPRGAFTGALLGTRARYQTRSGNVEAVVWKYTRGFRADAGFVSQVGVVDAQFSGDRVFWGPSGNWLTRFAIGTGYYPTVHDTTPTFTNAWRFVRLAYEGPAGLQYATYLRMRTETFGGVRYDFWTPWMMLQAQPWSRVSTSVEATFGGEIDRAAQRLARTIRLSPMATARITRNAEIRVRHSMLRLRAGDQSLLRAGVTEARLAYHPTSRAFARVLVQYRTTDRPGASLPLVVPSRTRSLASQLLFSYRVNAQTAALLGYGDTREAPNETATPGSVDAATSLRPTVRSVFVKLSYAWRP